MVTFSPKNPQKLNVVMCDKFEPALPASWCDHVTRAAVVGHASCYIDGTGGERDGN